jgi:hypothetical protein
LFHRTLEVRVQAQNTNPRTAGAGDAVARYYFSRREAAGPQEQRLRPLNET